MDNESPKPLANAQPTNPKPVIQPPQAEAVNQQAEPKLDIPNEAASALLTISNLQGARRPKSKPPTVLLISAISLIVLAILVSYLMGAFKSGANTTSSNPGSGVGLPNQSSTTGGNDTSNQINQDVKACSDPVNAATVC